jgi:hypothetical protein
MTTTKLRIFALLVVILCLCGWAAYKGSERTYYAAQLLKLTPGDAILRDGELAGSFFIWGGMPFAAHPDLHGNIYIGVMRKRSTGVLVFRPDGTFDHEITLKAQRDGTRPGLVYAMNVSASGNRLWVAYPGRRDMRVSVYDMEGQPRSLWALADGGVLQIAAAGEDAAYLWDMGHKLQTFALGSPDYRTWDFLMNNPVLVDNGWIWGVEPVRKPKPTRYDYSLPSYYRARVWRQKPGEERQEMCRTTLPGHGGDMPFWRDNSGNLYVVIRLSKWRDGRKAGSWVYRVSPKGKAETLFNASELLDRGKEIGAFLRVDRNGALLFEATGRLSSSSKQEIYRIYKAIPARRWRVWLRKLGIG